MKKAVAKKKPEQYKLELRAVKGDGEVVASLDPDKEVFIKDALLQKLLRFDAELKNSLLSVQSEEYKWQLETHAHTQRQAALQQAASQAQAQFKNVVSEIEREYSVDMRKYAYDSETGLLTRIEA